MATDIQPTETPKHVPAWKRLGLKLKYAKDTADPARESNGDVGNDTTNSSFIQPHDLGKRAADEEQPSAPSSKRRKSEAKRENRKKAADPAAGLGISNHQAEPTAEVEESSKHIVFGDMEAAAGKQLQRRKSVTFTPDTKQEDGFSAAKIFKSSLPPGHPRATVSSEAGDLAKQDDAPAPVSPKEAKRSKKANKSKSAATSLSTSITSPPSDKSAPAYLQYLQQYHADRANWKFNTNKQQLLFKHAFDTHRIPPAYTSALVKYISGLKSPRPRQQLAREADAILADCYRAHGAENGPAAVDLAMESPAARQAAYHAALERAQAGHQARGGTNTAWDDEQAAEIAHQIERASRAEQVLYEALMAHLHPELLAEQQQAAKAAAKAETEEQAVKEKPVKKSRKARTEVSSSEESSSSSSESSESSSSESESESDGSEDSDDSDAKVKASAGRTPKAPKRQPIFGKQLLDNVFGKRGGDGSSSEAPSDEGSDADDESD